MRKPSAIPRFESVILILLFCAGLSLPWLDSLCQIDSAEPVVERRELQERPPLPTSLSGLRTFTRDFEQWYSDHFGMRDSFIRWHNRITVLVLRSSTRPDTVHLGLNGWYFHAGKYLNYHRRDEVLSTGEIAWIASILQEREIWLRRQRIPFHTLFVPIKSTIYPEFMPPQFNRLREESPFDALLDYTRTHTDVDLIDLSEDLVPEKGKGLLYRTADHHWSDLGGFVASRRLLQRIQQDGLQVQIPSWDDLVVRTWRNAPPGKLAEYLAIEDVTTETRTIAALRKGGARRMEAITIPNPYYPGRRHFAMQGPAADTPDAVVFRDSFSVQMLPFLTESFGRSVWINTPLFRPDVVLRERPDVVIHEMVERALLSEWEPNSPEVARPLLMQLFKDSGRTLLSLSEKEIAQAASRGSTLSLPLKSADDISRVVIRMQVESSAAFSLVAQYRHRDRAMDASGPSLTALMLHALGREPPPPPTLQRTLEWRIPEGREEWYLPVPVEGLTGPITLRVRAGADPPVVRELEVRNVPYPHESP